MKKVCLLLSLSYFISTHLIAQKITSDEIACIDAWIKAKAEPKKYSMILSNYAFAMCIRADSSYQSDTKLVAALKELKTSDSLRYFFYGQINYFFSGNRALILDMYRVKTKKKGKIEEVISMNSMTSILNIITKTNRNFALSNNTITSATKDIKYASDTMASFPGGEKAMFAYILKEVRYPSYEKTHNTTGKVLVRFVIEKDGSVSNVQVMKPASPLLDDEACRLIKMMPNWSPAYEYGQPVRIYFTLPISFSLN